MESKTPQFDALLDKILNELVPHERECEWSLKNPHCEKQFDITAEDIEFLKILRVPAPAQCPTCRLQRRLSFINWTRFFKRDCQAPGHSEKVISTFPDSCPFPIVDNEYYRSDEFNAGQHGFAYDPNKSVYEQLYDLRTKVPMPAIVQDPSNVNADYSMGGRHSKDVYYSTGAFEAENVMYANGAFQARDVADVFFLENGDRVYEVLRSSGIVQSSYVYYSKDCMNSHFLFDCRNCTNCFGCVNLRNKSHCWFNEQLTKDEYEKRLVSINLGNRNDAGQLKNKFWDFVKTQPAQASQNISSENVYGIHSRSAKDAFDVINMLESENVRHTQGCVKLNDSMDITIAGASHHLYETVHVGSQSSNTRFSSVSKYLTDCEFMINCRTCSNCFGCIGIENKEYHIFNAPFEPDDYWKKVDEIKTTMLQNGEYGRGVPMELSPFAYNISTVQAGYPLDAATAEMLGHRWQDETQSNVGSMNILKAEDVPADINNVDDGILEKAILSERSGRPFRIAAQELVFYRRENIPLPLLHPYERMEDRLRLFGGFRYFSATCNSCQKSIQSALDPDQGFMLYCEDCYQMEVL